MRLLIHSFIPGTFLTFLSVQLRPIPIHVVFFVEYFEDLVFPKRQLIISCGVEVVLGDRLHDGGRSACRRVKSGHTDGSLARR